MTGYTRQSTATIQPGLLIKAANHNAEFDSLQAAFNSSTGHAHTGASLGDGPKINLVSSISGILPVLNGGTGVTTKTGTGSVVLNTSPTIVTPALTGPITVSTGGLTVSTGGITVSAGGITVTGTSSITGTTTVTGAATVTNGLTVSASGITVTGTSSITGTTTVTGAFNATTSVSDNSNRVFSLSHLFAVLQASPSNPTNSGSLTEVMCGLAQSFTPTTSGRILVNISGQIFNAAGDGAITQIRYSTGSAPANGDAVTGTAAGTKLSIVDAGGLFHPFTLTAIITGLSISTAYWFDITEAAITAGVCNITTVNVSITEI